MVSAPGVSRQLSKPKTGWQSGNWLIQQGLSQKPGPCTELGMGMKTKTMMTAEQMWNIMPSVWLEGQRKGDACMNRVELHRGCDKPQLPRLHFSVPCLVPWEGAPIPACLAQPKPTFRPLESH